MKPRSISAIVLCATMLLPSVAAAQSPTASASPSVLPSAVEEASPAEEAPLANATRPLTHDELLTIRGACTQGGCGSRTLVADAIIEREPPIRGEVERIDSGKVLGTLPRGGVPPGDPVVLARKPAAAGLPRGGSPITGLLAIELRSQSLQYLGRVETPAGTYLTPIEPAAMAVADALPAGALIAARGWLTSDAVAATDPADPSAPDEFGIPVPHRSLEMFTQDLSHGAAQPASYLLRHVANPVVGEEPALGWQVIARLDPAEDVALPNPTLSADIARPGGLDWRPGLERQPPADGWWLYSTAWAGGFASVHQGRDRVLSGWVSPDGRAWKGTELPSGIRSVQALLRLGDGLAIIADESPPYADWRFDVWRSDDGLEWRQVGRQRVRAPQRFDAPSEFEGYRRLVQGYWTLGDRIVALETYTTTRCCGRSNGLEFVARQPRQPNATFAWTSRDGKRWQRQRARGVPATVGYQIGHRVTQGDRELFVDWGVPSQVLARSTDGVSWDGMGRYPDELDDVSRALFTRAADGFVLAGSVEGTRDDGWLDTFVVWHSTDGTEWDRTYERPDGRPNAIVSSGGTVIVAGNDPDRTDPTLDPLPERPWLLVSDDGGRTWDPELAWVGEDDWCLRSLSTTDGVVSLDAACATPDAASTYAVRAGPTAADPVAAGRSPATLPVWNDAIRDPEPPDRAVPLRRGTRAITPGEARRGGFEVIEPTAIGRAVTARTEQVRGARRGARSGWTCRRSVVRNPGFGLRRRRLDHRW